jgi:hypothetical protein
MDIITSAGLVSAPVDLKRAALREIRAVLRRQDATDTEIEDALESLVELAKEPDGLSP